MIRTAVISLATGKVVNITRFQQIPAVPLDGELWIASNTAKIGDAWNGEVIVESGEAPPPLQVLKDGAQASIDAYYQVLFDQAVPNNAMKAEYDAAYMVAKRWLEDPVEPIPERIKALAESYGVTNQQAAGVVVQKWTEAQAVAFDLRGAARLRAKLAIRQAGSAAGVIAAEQAGRSAMAAVVYTV